VIAGDNTRGQGGAPTGQASWCVRAPGWGLGPCGNESSAKLLPVGLAETGDAWGERVGVDPGKQAVQQFDQPPGLPPEGANRDHVADAAEQRASGDLKLRVIA
jgi:hypothetical protein